MEIADPITSVLANKSPDLWTTFPGATVFDAIEQMAERNVGALPVMQSLTEAASWRSSLAK